MGPLWGIDLGGTKIEGVVLEDRDNPVVLRRSRLPTERDKGYQHILLQVAKLIEVLSSEVGIRPTRIGIAHPGAIDPTTQLLKNSNTTVLNGMPVKEDLEDALGIPIKMANDANCFAIAETKMGIVKEVVPDAKLVFGAIMGTGVGGGLVMNGEVWRGRHGIGGEWGHVFLDKSGGGCYCGCKGCVETVISGIALEKYYQNIVGVRKPLKEIIELHERGRDEVATMTVKRLITYFGRAFSSVINMLDPDVIVIGGGVGNVDLLYTEGVREVSRYIFNNKLETPFLKPKLGDSAGVFGAAFL